MPKLRSNASNTEWMNETAVWQMSEEVDIVPSKHKETKCFLRKRVCLMLDSLIEWRERHRRVRS